MEYRTADQCRAAGVTYHLVPVPVWEERGGAPTYVPEAYDEDGFIHTTNGLDPLLQVANLFYTGDARPFMVLVLDTAKITSEVRYDDEDRIYPHIYGPLNTDAVVGRFIVDRDADGTFTGFRRG